VFQKINQAKIESALQFWNQGELQRALPLMLEVWNATRSQVLAARIDVLSLELNKQLPAVDLTVSKSVSGALEQAIKSSSWLEVGPLIEAIFRAVRTAPGQYTLLVELAAKHSNDCRMATALHELVLNPPFVGSNGALYGDVISAMERIDDPRFFSALVRWSQQLELRRRYIRKEKKDLDVLREVAFRIVARGQKKNEKGEQEYTAYESSPWLTQLLEQIPAKKTKPVERDLNALLESVYENPTDVTRRLVYADALIESGDVRGEFISLQCNRSENQKPTAREKALLKNHGRQWLGELDSGIRKQGLVYKNGFLSKMWCTIEALEFDSLTWGPRAVKFANRADLPCLQQLYLRAEDAALVTTVHSRVTTLGLAGEARHVEAVLLSGAFPSLEILELSSLVVPRFKQIVPRIIRITGKAFDRLGALFQSLKMVSATTQVEIADGLGLSDDKVAWCLRFSGPEYNTVHVSGPTTKASPVFALQRLGQIPMGLIDQVHFDEHIDQNPFSEVLKRMGINNRA
jgi:uncharacterized protein (TIGR02996 family)